jgi:hypothetical protein
MNQNEFEAVRVPLLEATIQTRFPGDARIEALRGHFQQAIPCLPVAVCTACI